VWCQERFTITNSAACQNGHASNAGRDANRHANRHASRDAKKPA
jgi:hypothetical protein